MPLRQNTTVELWSAFDELDLLVADTGQRLEASFRHMAGKETHVKSS